MTDDTSGSIPEVCTSKSHVGITCFFLPFFCCVQEAQYVEGLERSNGNKNGVNINKEKEFKVFWFVFCLQCMYVNDNMHATI